VISIRTAVRKFAKLCVVPTFAATVSVAAVTGAAAQAPPDGGFGKPLACDLGRDCWIANLPDAISGPEAGDFRCGFRTYDGHKGTDFALRDFAALDDGVDVVAAAPGRVRAVRDGEPEFLWLNADRRGEIGKRQCGNGVVIDHARGWQSQYCHLREGSVAVRQGDAVARGQVLGRAGMSGRTAFPHVHVEFRRDGTPVDPFTGEATGSGCGNSPGRGLWRAEERIGYPVAALYAAGFATQVPDGPQIWARARSPAGVSAHAPALVFWAAAYGVAAGDRIRLRIADPSGAIVMEREIRMDRNRTRQMEAAGRRAPPRGWPRGIWQGTAELETSVDGKAIRRTISVPLEIR